jgi:hypothetical protein
MAKTSPMRPSSRCADGELGCGAFEMEGFSRLSQEVETRLGIREVGLRKRLALALILAASKREQGAIFDNFLLMVNSPPNTTLHRLNTPACCIDRSRSCIPSSLTLSCAFWPAQSDDDFNAPSRISPILHQDGG